MVGIACCSGKITAPTTPLEGQEESIGNGHKCYVSQPKNATKPGACVILATDIFGYTLVNVRVVADNFAREGYLAVVPDLFKGTEPPPELMNSFKGFTNKNSGVLVKASAVLQLARYVPGFLMRNSIPKGCDIVENVASAVKEKYGVKFIGLQGYCWGGGIAVHLAHKPNVVDAIAVAHPSELKLPVDIEKIQKPAYFACPEHDHAISKTDFDLIKDILSKKINTATTTTGVENKAQWIDGVEHGFATRGNEDDPHVREMRAFVLQEAVAFFDRVGSANKIF
ncbi:hypothetical protein HK100_010230 [Physocladia obscura]|uniref:Dienelactone hydrolase domain-containing protein n=1 Tax=Physocladia obscura TaxID=109957 RepID=A0AAD5SLD1_9FUNG|nr:hypothetical protein HK100_010230 [Physocladia obscura]